MDGRSNISDRNFTTEYKNNQKESLLYNNHIFDKYLTEENDELNPENILDSAMSQEGIIYIISIQTNFSMLNKLNKLNNLFFSFNCFKYYCATNGYNIKFFMRPV